MHAPRRSATRSRHKRTRAPLSPRFVAFEPKVHNVLIIVHPDFSPQDSTQPYRDGILRAATAAREVGIPVFLAPDEPHPERVPVVASRLLDIGACPVPDYRSVNYRVKARWLSRRAQREVDSICGVLDRPPDKVHAAFGGMFAAACVWLYAAGWCRVVHAPESRYYLDYDPEDILATPRRPIAVADILQDIVIL